MSGYALEWLPRISRAQSMDVLSSQANIAGYKAVIIAANTYGRFMPMLMTAAGTVKAARVLILGVGVAGLQAIATAKRLGAVIEASDVRPSVKDQVESLGAKWVDVPYANDEERQIAEGVGGYARPMPPEWMARQARGHPRALQERRHPDHDRADSRAGRRRSSSRPATVAAMKPGAVIVDLAVEQGGNVEGSELDQIVAKNGVKIVGFGNLPALVASRRERALRAQRAQFPGAVAQRQERRVRGAEGRRDHQGDAGVRERRRRARRAEHRIPNRGRIIATRRGP